MGEVDLIWRCFGLRGFRALSRGRQRGGRDPAIDSRPDRTPAPLRKVCFENFAKCRGSVGSPPPPNTHGVASQLTFGFVVAYMPFGLCFQTHTCSS